jgi:hypothetical protein
MNLGSPLTVHTETHVGHHVKCLSSLPNLNQNFHDHFFIISEVIFGQMDMHILQKCIKCESEHSIDLTF